MNIDPLNVRKSTCFGRCFFVILRKKEKKEELIPPSY